MNKSLASKTSKLLSRLADLHGPTGFFVEIGNIEIEHDPSHRLPWCFHHELANSMFCNRFKYAEALVYGLLDYIVDEPKLLRTVIEACEVKAEELVGAATD